MRENPYESPPAYDWLDEPLVPVEIVETAAPARSPYWGFWATVGLSAAIAGIYLAANVAIVVVYMVIRSVADPSFDVRHAEELLEYNGLLLSIGTILSAPVALGGIWGAIWLRRRTSVKEYLALRGVSWGRMLLWLALTVLFLFGEDGFLQLVQYDVEPEFMIEAWRTAVILPLLWITLIVFAPLVEEAFFRGFFFVGLQHSPVGNAGAVLITSLAWAMIHTQYDVTIKGVIFALGIFLGIARIRTNSLYVPMAMHGLINLAATVQTGLLMGQG